MKRVLIPMLLLIAAPAWGAGFGPVAFAPADRQSLRIQQTSRPVFPRALKERGVVSGDARIAVSVDHTGVLRDWLFVGYTHPEFAEAALAAMQEWRYEPLRVHGEARAAKVEVVFHFEVSGVVVTMDFTNSIAIAFETKFGSPDAKWPCSLQEVDRIPVPVEAPAPAYPKELADRGIEGDVVIGFYIDEKGAPRMVAVVEAADDDLGALAAEAVKAWKFEPPTRRGKPVLVRAQQAFQFRKQAGGG
jgi:TonB family protein